MKKIYLFAFCLFSLISTAQNKDDTKSLEVVGSGEISVSPDIGILSIGITKIDSLFSEAISGLNSKSVDISGQLKEIGFSEENIKTKNFNVHRNQVYRNNRHVDSGYIATQQIQLDFENNKENITRILDQFSGSSTDFNLSFNFKLSDSLKEAVQQQIIELATRDAFEKARLISSASDIKLKDIKEIKYGTNPDAGMRLFNRNEGLHEIVLSGESTASQGFTPEDIKYSDNILVIWLLE